MSTPTQTVAIVGGGVSGLATAFFIRQAKPDWRVTVFEKEAEPGGKVRSSVQNGFTFDWGPNGFLANVPETVELAKALGLEEVLQPAADTAKYRFLYQDGGLRPLPDAPPKFLTTELLSPFEKVRAGLEVFSRPSDAEETVYAFVARHFGAGFADALAGAAVLGVTAGDAKALSVDALFPGLRALEREHGSLLRGLVKQQREAKKTSQTGGPLDEFPRRAASANSSRLCERGSVTVFKPAPPSPVSPLPLGATPWHFRTVRPSAPTRWCWRRPRL